MCRQNLFLDIPDVVVKATNTSTMANSTDLTCKASGVPDSYTYLTWEHTWPGHAPVLRFFPGLEVLHLEKLTYQDSGMYTCRVKNGAKFSHTIGAGEGSTYFLVQGRCIYQISITSLPIVSSCKQICLKYGSIFSSHRSANRTPSYVDIK